MRWKPKNEPKPYERRWVEVFALIPIKMTDGTCVWLETYELEVWWGPHHRIWVPETRRAINLPYT